MLIARCVRNLKKGGCIMTIYTKYKCKVCSEWWTGEQRNKADIDSIEEEIGLCKLHKYIDEQGVGV